MSEQQDTLFPQIPEDDIPAINLVQTYLDDIAPENTASIPIAFSLELDDNGDWKWFSYLSVRTDRLGELDAIATSVSLRRSALAAMRDLHRDVLAAVGPA